MTDPSFKAPLSAPPLKSDGPIPDLNYEEPSWSGLPPTSPSAYTLEVLKNGVIIESHPLSGKNFFVLGRHPSVDIPMDHPSLSRVHAVLQFRPNAGFFLYDLSSAHGTQHNKRQVLPRTYIPLRVGHSIRLGGSSRLLLLQGPQEDEEEEISMEEVKENMKSKREAQLKAEEPSKDGISWGMGEDATEEDIMGDKPPPSSTPLNLDDPKKTLRHWFEREGYELEYNVEEKGHSNYLCSLDIPTDTGEPLIAEAKAGRKKDAMVQCALEACRLLDARGLLRSSTSSSAKRRADVAKNWEEKDYYDSDEDEFFDRTGSVQEKRLKRMRLANKSSESTVETHDSLIKKRSVVEAERDKVSKELDMARKASLNGSEDLDDYMAGLKGGAMDKYTLDKLKSRMHELMKEHGRLSKLIEITKPVSLNVPMAESAVKDDGKQEKKKASLFNGVMIGKRSGGGMFGKTRVIPKSIGRVKELSDDSDTKRESRLNAEEKGKDNIDKTLSKNNNVSSPNEESSFKDTSLSSKEESSLKDTSVSSKEESSLKDTSLSSKEESSLKDTSLSSKEEYSSKEQYSSNEQSSSKKQSSPHKTIASPKPGDSSPLTEPRSSTSIKPKENNAKKSEASLKPSPKTSSICDEGKIDGSYSNSLSDPKYATWVPPANQSGDGRTSLNDKFGY